jgi:hypothetical protein
MSSIGNASNVVRPPLIVAVFEGLMSLILQVNPDMSAGDASTELNDDELTDMTRKSWFLRMKIDIGICISNGIKSIFVRISRGVLCENV